MAWGTKWIRPRSRSHANWTLSDRSHCSSLITAARGDLVRAQVESHIYRPLGALGGYVDCLWYRRGEVPNRRRELSMPTGSADVIINLNDDRITVFENARDTLGITTRGAIVHGPQTRSFVINNLKHVHFVGIHFKPGGSGLLGVSATEILNRHLSLHDLWGDSVGSLREQLMGCDSPRQMFMLLERVLSARMHEKRIVKPVVSFALRTLNRPDPFPRIAELQRRSGYSDRRFTDLFKQAVGLPPKKFARVLRLGATLQHLATGCGTLAEVAAANGYFDHAHLTNEFQELVGISPSEYRPSARSVMHMECLEEEVTG
jgi:AraC-like DNA-binding protein